MIGPAEPGLAAAPPIKAKTVWVGVLQEGSPLTAIIGGRCIPVRQQHARIEMLRDPAGGSRAVLCMAVPIDRLQKLHADAIVEWLAAIYSITPESAEAEFGRGKDFLISRTHFAGVVEAFEKEKVEAK